MKIEVGKHYLNASGEIVKIIDKESNYYKDSNSRFYYNNGFYDYHIETKQDLIAEIPKVLHYEILRLINNYYTKDKFRKVTDEICKAKGITND